MKFFEETGQMAIGSRVRLLGDIITRDAAEIYRAYGTDLQPKWFPVFYLLTKHGENSVTSIAEEIGHSHVSVSKIVAEMSKVGLITEKSDTRDRRRTKVGLSKKGREISRKIEEQYADVGSAIEEISAQAKHNLWAAIGEWETLLNSKSLRDRVIEKKKARAAAGVKIEPYQAKYQEAFYKLNKEWITKYFKMEKPDREALEDPKGYILDHGGFIFVATLDKEPVGVCALIKREDLDCYELAKMAVSPKAQGRSIGYLLGKAVIDKASTLKSKRLFVESNTILEPAIRLYEKLGFVKIEGPPTPYERCNIQMELKLKKAR